jgi:hypothetical protein
LIVIGVLVIGSVVMFKAANFARNLVTEIFFSIPTEATVSREFLDRYPAAQITNVELIFEQNGEAVYLITGGEVGSSEKRKYDFALTRSSGSWKWCDDQTDRKCGSIVEAK